jgi:hypothetical protein
MKPEPVPPVDRNWFLEKGGISCMIDPATWQVNKWQQVFDKEEQWLS